MKYQSTITGWGSDALGFLEDEDNSFLIIFNDNAPEELTEIAVIHSQTKLHADPIPGDTLIICDKAFTITAIGTEALHTLRELGHCTLGFNGGDVPLRPGYIMLKGESPLKPDDVAVGGTIELY